MLIFTDLYIFGEDCKPFIKSHTEKLIVAYVGKEPNIKDPYVSKEKERNKEWERERDRESEK